MVDENYDWSLGGIPFFFFFLQNHFNRVKHSLSFETHLKLNEAIVLKKIFFLFSRQCKKNNTQARIISPRPKINHLDRALRNVVHSMPRKKRESERERNKKKKWFLRNRNIYSSDVCMYNIYRIATCIKCLRVGRIYKQ